MVLAGGHEPRFEPLRTDHFELLHRWLASGPVLHWYARREISRAEIEARYGPCVRGERPTHCYLFHLQEEPAGFLQTYRIADYPEYAASIDADEGWAGLDFYTGEARFRGRGLAPGVLDRFVRDVVFGLGGVHACVSGPRPENLSAIRTLERAGFEYLRIVAGEYLMLRRRDPTARG